MDEKKASISISIREFMPAVTELLEDGQTVELKGGGISMRPFLIGGRDDIFMVSPKGREPRLGDIYTFRRADGSYATHRICRINSDGSFDFVGDGQRFVEKGIAREQLAAFVPKVRRNGKIINCEKGVIRGIMTARMLVRVRCPRFMAFASRAKRFFTGSARGGQRRGE